MMNDFKNLINQHCLESARTIHKNTDLKYYTVLGTIERNQSIYLHKKFQLEDGSESKTIPIFPF